MPLQRRKYQNVDLVGLSALNRALIAQKVRRQLAASADRAGLHSFAATVREGKEP